MSGARRERRKLLREIKKNSNEPLDSIITPEISEEIRRRHLQRIKNEQISQSEIENESSAIPSFGSNLGGSSYDGLKSLILKRDWDNY
jgi:hypothetical protein